MENKKIKHIGWIRIIAMIVPYFIIVGVFQLVGYWFAGIRFQPEIVKTTMQHTIVSFFSLLGTLLIIWIFMKFWDKEKFINLGFQTKNRLKEFSVGIGLGALVMGFGYLLFLTIGQISFVNIDFDIQKTLLSVAIFIFVAVTEEVLVRGYILKNLMYSFNKYVALIVSSLLFSLMHAANPNIDWLSMINLFLAGILLGISYIHTRNLWFPIALHLSWNLFQSLLGFNVSGQDIYSLVNFKLEESNALNGGEFGFEGSVFCLTVEIVLIFIVVGYYQKKKVVVSS